MCCDQAPMTQDIYDRLAQFVAGVFDRCSGNYRAWSAVASFGLIRAWRRACVAGLDMAPDTRAQGVDLMAGTGEVWPHLLARFPNLGRITAIDISPGMHAHALDRLHRTRSDRIEHLCADMLQTDLPDASADFAVSTFGLKTFNAEQHRRMAEQLARILKPGAPLFADRSRRPAGLVAAPGLPALPRRRPAAGRARVPAGRAGFHDDRHLHEEFRHRRDG